MNPRAASNAVAARRLALLKRGRVLIRAGVAENEAELRRIHDELDRIERGTWKPEDGT